MEINKILTQFDKQKTQLLDEKIEKKPQYQYNMYDLQSVLSDIQYGKV